VEKVKAEDDSLRQKNIQNAIKYETIHPEVESDEVIRARLEENKRRRAAGRAIGEEIRSLAQIERGANLTKLKPILQVEFNYYNDINQSCATRLAIVNLAEKLKKPEKKGCKKVSDNNDDSEEKEVIEIKDNDEMDEDNDGSYKSRRRAKHTKKKRKQKSVMK
jgi:hypothetical protein